MSYESGAVRRDGIRLNVWYKAIKVFSQNNQFLSRWSISGPPDCQTRRSVQIQ